MASPRACHALRQRATDWLIGHAGFDPSGHCAATCGSTNQAANDDGHYVRQAVGAKAKAPQLCAGNDVGTIPAQTGEAYDSECPGVHACMH